MGGIKSKKPKRLEFGRHHSECFNTSTSKRKLITWATCLTLVGGPMAFLPLMKPKAAEAAKFEAAKNKVGSVIEDLKEIFEAQEGIAKKQLPASHEKVQELISAVESYNKNAAEKIEISGKNDKEKIRALNEYLGIKVKGKTPNYITYQTVLEFEKAAYKINLATLHGSEMEEAGKSAGELTVPESPYEEVEEKEAAPPVTFAPPKKEVPPEEKKEEEITPYEEEEVEVEVVAPEESRWAQMSDLEKVNFYMTVLDTLKKTVIKPAKPKKPKAPKAPGKKASEEKKEAYEEKKAEYEEKAEAYDTAKEEYDGRLNAYKQLTSMYKTLSKAQKKLEKGKTLKPKEQEAVDGGLGFVQTQLGAAEYVFSGTMVTNSSKAEYMTNVQAGTYENLEEAHETLKAQVRLFVNYFNEKIKKHEARVNKGIAPILGKKAKVDYKKQAKKLGYDLTTVGGCLQMLDWIYHNDNELYYRILQQEADKLSLSTEVEAAVNEIANIRALRAQIWHEKKTAQSFQGGKAALEAAIGNAEKTFEADDPLLETARALLEAEGITYSNMYYEAALGLLAIQEAQIWYDTSEINNVKETNQAEIEDNLNTAKLVYGWSFGEHPQPVDMSVSRKFAYHAIHIMSPVTLHKYEMHVYHKGEPGEVKGSDVAEWEAGIKGSLAHKFTSDFVPIYGESDYMPQVLTRGGVYPYYGKGIEPTYADFETNEVLNYSPYGFTVGEVERQQIHMASGDWGEAVKNLKLDPWSAHHEKLNEIPEGYNPDLDIVVHVQMKGEEIIDKIKDDKKTYLENSIPAYNQGLTEAGELEKKDGTRVTVYAPVSIGLLELFGEEAKGENYKIVEGKIVPATEGEELKTAEYVKHFYKFWNEISTEQKMEALTTNVLINTLLPLHEYLGNNLTDEAKKDPHIAYLLENIPKITSKKQAEKALEELQKTPLWIGTYYSFETPDDEYRYGVAATANELLQTGNFSRLHQIALAELAAVEANAMKKTVYGEGKGPEIEEPKEIKVLPWMEPMPAGVIDELYMNQSFSETQLIKGTGMKTYMNLEDINWGEEYPSMFGNDEAKMYDASSAWYEAMWTYNNEPESKWSSAAKELASELRNALESHLYSGEHPREDIVRVLQLLDEGNLKEGIQEMLRLPGFEAGYENLSKFYTLKLDEKGITYIGLGTTQKINFIGNSRHVWAAMLGDEELTGPQLYQIDLMFKYIFAEAIPLAFEEKKFANEADVAAGKASEVGEMFNTGKVAAGFGDIHKQKFGLGLTIASPTVESTREYFGNVFTSTITVSFSHETFQALGIDEHPAGPGELEIDPKEIKMKGKEFTLDFLGVEFRFPAIKKRVKIESIQFGLLNVVTADLLEKDETLKPEDVAAFNPILSTTIAIDAVKKDHFTLQIYGTPAFLYAMGEPTFLGEIGMRSIFFKDSHALLMQVGTEMIYPGTTQDNIVYKPVKGSLIWKTPVGISLSASAWAHYADDNMDASFEKGYKKLVPGFEVMLTIRPGEWKSIKQKKKELKSVDEYIKKCKDSGLEYEEKVLKIYRDALKKGALKKKDAENLQKLKDSVDEQIAE
jgi:hypothetical protein